MVSAGVVRIAALVVLCLQNASNTLLIRYSRAILHERWSTLSTVIVGEAVKLTCVLVMMIRTQTTTSTTINTHGPTPTSGSNTRAMDKSDKPKRRHHAGDDKDQEMVPLTSAPPSDTEVTITETESIPIVFVSRPLSTSERLSQALHTVWHVFRTTPRLCVPGGIYLIQNVLQQQALQRLPAATYALIAQTKLLTTAFFAVWLLGRRLSLTQIRALYLLFVGVVLVLQAPATPTPTSNSMLVITANQTAAIPSPAAAAASTSQATSSSSSWLLGLIYAIAVATLSGFGGCYLELLLKAPRVSASGALPPLSLWEINSGLCLWGLIFGFGSLLILPEERVFLMTKGFFHDYSIITAGVIGLSAGGGIAVAIVVKYADNIIKGFAVTLSVVLTSILSWQLFGDVTPDITFVCGAMVVLVAVANYNDPAAAPTPVATATANAPTAPTQTAPLAASAAAAAAAAPIAVTVAPPGAEPQKREQ